MFIVSLTYKKSLQEVETHIDAHRDFLDRNYAAGIFLASGPKSPRTGGVILANSTVSKDQIENILADDPFNVHELAHYEVTEFTPSKNAKALDGIL